MIPAQCFRFKKYQGENYEDADGHYLLDDLELEHVEWPACGITADLVGRYHQRVFQQGNAPADEDRRDQAHMLEFQMPIPGNRHEGIGRDEQEYGL